MIDYTPEVVCMAQVVHNEARGESEKGAEMVAQVVLNRSKDPQFRPTICQVAKQPHQFTNYSTRIKPDSRSFLIALRVIQRNIRTKLRYFNTIGPKRAKRVGNHLFW